MTAYVDMSADIQYHIPGCPAPLILRAIKRSVREFFTKALAHRQTLPVLLTVTGQQDYALVPPVDTEIVQVLNVRLDGKGLMAISESLLDGRNVDWTSQIGKPTDYFLPQRDLIRLYPVPNADGLRLEVRVALRPDRAAVVVDTAIFERWYEELVEGALSELFLLNNTGWQNGDQATIYASRFAAAIEKARLEVHNDDQPKLRAVRYGGI